ncbi:DEAD/DEAH box helicase [Methylomicrobium lacus]|uniref:DEAD/DEAH box helicase n=1 Tax=Methylomicrobium lacus TaxID=136992 RepID=UPI0035A88BF8
MSFSSLGLSEPLLRAISDSGYTTPTPIQQKAIPSVLSGRDLLAAAQTGTGKTAGFTLPILQRLAEKHIGSNRPVRALILTPTRELAAQVAESVTKYGAHQMPRLKSDVVFGGVKINPQMMRLRGGVDILTATPGRLLDLVSQNAVKLNQVEILVLDEADRMLDMGFIRDINKILALLPKKRQNLLFSATFSADIRKLTQNLLVNPVQIEVAVENAAADTVEQIAYTVNKTAKTALLTHLIKSNDWRQVLVFTSTKHGANRLTEKLNSAQITAKAIHGNKSQGARTSALADFKSGDIRVLVATDVAARGIDIAQLPHVVNYELPRSSADYVHRIGRTGRAGRGGLAVSLISQDENNALRLVEKLIGSKIARERIAGFEEVETAR